MRAANQFADTTTGVVYVHASPAAVCPHVEWALSSTLNARANLKWTPQPAMPGQLRAVTNWVGPVGTGAQLANALRSWSVLRFEVTEDPSHGVDGHRWCHTPQLGLWSGAMSANGDFTVLVHGPISITLYALLAAVLVFSIRSKVVARKRAATAEKELVDA